MSVRSHRKIIVQIDQPEVCCNTFLEVSAIVWQTGRKLMINTVTEAWSKFNTQERYCVTMHKDYLPTPLAKMSSNIIEADWNMLNYDSRGILFIAVSVAVSLCAFGHNSLYLFIPWNLRNWYYSVKRNVQRNVILLIRNMTLSLNIIISLSALNQGLFSLPICSKHNGSCVPVTYTTLQSNL